MKRPAQQIDIAGICGVLGIRVSDASLLETAFTHQSYANGRDDAEDNQRLEFLGDAVLGLLAADALYRADPAADEGVLTMRRSALVSGKALARVAGRLGLTAFMRFSPGVHDETERSGTRTAAALLEAVFGAVWLDGGHDAAARLFARLFDDATSAAAGGAGCGDPRGRLQTESRRLGLGEPRYEILSETGNGHDFTYRAEARVGDLVATGEGGSKRRAFAAAAERLLGLLPPREAQNG